MRVTHFFFYLFALALLSSCGTSRTMRSYSKDSYSSPQYPENYLNQSNSSDLLMVQGVSDNKVFDKGKNENENRERKIIKNANFSLEVKAVDTVSKSIERLAEKYHGYVQESESYRVVIRVKDESFDQVISEIEELGKVKYKNVFGEDVSNRYYDAQIRLENALQSRTRYLELLKEAENVQAALLVEKELERLNGTIELLKAQINSIDHLSTFATISVDLEEKKKLGVLGYVFKGVWVGVKWLFVRN